MLKITFEGSIADIESFLDPCDYGSSHIVLMGKRFSLCNIDVASRGIWSDHVKIVLKESSVEHKSQEEVAAEEAVRKAKESLLAAEETLKKIKEKE